MSYPTSTRISMPMFGHDQIVSRMQGVISAIDFDYHKDHTVSQRIAEALLLMQDCRDIVDPKDSRVGRESIAVRIKLLTTGLTSLNSAIVERTISGNRINVVSKKLLIQAHAIIKLMITKTSVEAIDKKVNKIADTNLRSSLADTIIQVKTSKAQAADQQIAADYSQLKEVNDGFISEGKAFNQRLLGKNFGSRHRLIFDRVSLAVLAEPSISANRLSRTQIDYVVMAGVTVLLAQRVAIAYEPDPMAELDWLYAQDRATIKYKMRYVNVLKETANGQECLPVRGFPGVKMIWLLPVSDYSKIGGFKVKSVGLPWN